MFLFDGLLMLTILFFLYGLPGLIASLLLFKKHSSLERFLLGFFVSFVAFGLIHSIIGFLLGSISYISIIISWLVVLLGIWFLSDRKIDITSWPQDKKEQIALLGLVIVLLFTYFIRISSFSPIYLEFDPYFYLEGVKMLLNYGVIPLYDGSAWYPYNTSSSHRSPPIIHYTLGTWYYLYTQGASPERYLLSAVANFYPPIMAVGMAFFFYLLGYLLTKNRIIGLGLAIFAAYSPIFIYKFMSGVFEFQPYNFFIFSFIVAAFALFYEDNKYLWVLLLGILGTLLGAIASPAILVFLVIVLLFYAWDKEKSLWPVFFATLLGGIWLWIYLNQISKIKYALLMLSVPLAPYIKHYMSKLGKKGIVVLTSILLISLLLGYSFFGNILYSALVAAQYNTPLERTIQEQTLAPASLSVIGVLGTPADALLSSNNPLLSILGILYSIISLPGLLLNTIISLGIAIMQSFGMDSQWIPKEMSVAYGLYAIGVFLLLWDLLKRRWSAATLIALGSLILLIGLIKAKFQIYFVFGFLLMLTYLITKLVKIKHINELIIAAALIAFAGFGLTTNLSLSMASFVPVYGNNPVELQDFFQQLCATNQAFCNITPDNIPITLQYNPQLCQFYLYQKYGQQLDAGKQIRIQIACNYMPDVWLDPMEWLHTTTPKDSRIISWWDYGHWINYWAERKAVIRNEHSVLKMILDTAYAFVMGNESTLSKVMNLYGAQYALIDQEIVVGGPEIFGGKFFALNYLACAGANQTSVLYEPMQSECEWNNLWEVIRITDKTCNINDIRQGYVAVRRTYKGLTGNIQPAFEEAYCVTPNDGSLNISKLSNKFAISLLLQKRPSTLYISYKLNETDPRKKLQKALWIPLGNNTYLALYLKDKIWWQDGKWVDGYSDRTTRFYDSVLYKGFVLEELSGFSQVYNNNYVKLYLRGNMDRG